MRIRNIKTIVTKELRAYFDSPAAYIVLVLFLFLWEFLFFRGIFLTSEASLRMLFEYLPWMLLFLVPALTMGSVSQEKNDGTLELLLTHPLKSIDLVFGKFLAAVVMVVLALLFAIPIAWSLSSFGPLDWGIVMGQLLGSLGLVVALTSLGIFVSTLFASQISALLLTIFGAFFLTVSGFGLVTERMTPGMAKIFEQLSVLTHYQSMVRGVIDTRDVVYFVSVMVVFLALAHLQFMKMKYGNKRKIYRNQLSTVIILVGVVALVNVVGANIPGRIDLTQNKLYTLSDSTKEIISGVDGTINVTLYVSKELPAQVQPAVREVEDLMRDYETFGDGHILFSSKTPGANQDIVEEAQSKGVMPIQFNVIGEEEFQVKSGYFGLVVSYGEEFESIPLIQNTGELEYVVTSYIKKLTTTEFKSILFLSGHGEKRLQNDYGLMYKELEGLYEIDSVTSFAKDEEGNSPLDSVDVVVVAGPKNEIDEETQEALLSFVRSGGSVLFFVDTLAINPQTSLVEDNEASGADILENFGIMVQKDLVFDKHSNERITLGGGMTSIIMPYPFFVKAGVDENVPAFIREIKNVSLPWASSIEIDAGQVKESGFSYQTLFKTSRLGGHQTEEFIIAPDQSFSSLNEGVFVMAMSFTNDETGSRMVVVGDSEFLTDQFSANKAENLAFGQESIAWLAQDDALSQIRLKNVAQRQLAFENRDQAVFIRYSNIGFAVGLPIMIGLYRYWRRKRLQKKEYV